MTPPEELAAWQLEVLAADAGVPVETILAVLRDEEQRTRAIEVETRKPIRYTNRAARRAAARGKAAL